MFLYPNLHVKCLSKQFCLCIDHAFHQGISLSLHCGLILFSLENKIQRDETGLAKNAKVSSFLDSTGLFCAERNSVGSF